MMKPILIVIFMLVSSLCAFGQKSTPCGTDNDVRIEKNTPTVYITFERFGKALDASQQKLFNEASEGNSKKAGSDVWLRLHNNTCWPIWLVQYGMYLPKQKPGENPGERLKRMGILDDGAETGLFYSVMKGRNQIGYSGIDSFDYVDLLPGRSTLFSVARDAFKEGQSIKVVFIYDWEFQKGTERRGYITNEPNHYVEFSSYDLKTQSER